MSDDFKNGMHSSLTSFLQRDVFFVLKDMHLADRETIGQLHFHLKRLQRCEYQCVCLLLYECLL